MLCCALLSFPHVSTVCVMLYTPIHASLHQFAYKCNLHVSCMDCNVNKVCFVLRIWYTLAELVSCLQSQCVALSGANVYMCVCVSVAVCNE